MSDFELPPSPTPDALFQPEIVTPRWWREGKIWLAAAVGFVAGAMVMWALMTVFAGGSPSAAGGLAQEIDALKPVTPPPAAEPTAAEPVLVAKPAAGKPVAKSVPPLPPMPLEVKPPSAQAKASGSTLTLTAQGKTTAQGGITANVYIEGEYVGHTPVKARPVLLGKRTVRFDCIWKGKVYKGDDTVVDVTPNTDAAVEHTCDIWAWIGVPDEDKEQ